MKPTETSERLKTLMRTHKANSIAVASAPAPIPPAAPPIVAATLAPAPAKPQRSFGKPRWERVTVRLMQEELQKINDVVIATQQAHRFSKVTATDILRAGLRRIKDQEVIDMATLKALRDDDGRMAKNRIV